MKPAQPNHNDRDAITKQESYEDWDDDDDDWDDDDDDSSVNTESSVSVTFIRSLLIRSLLIRSLLIRSLLVVFRHTMSVDNVSKYRIFWWCYHSIIGNIG